MTTTPEGKVKAKVKKVLANYSKYGNIYSNWPVPGGYGKSTLDCLGCIRGFAFAIETKAPGEKPTPRQALIAAQMQGAGMMVFVIDGDTRALEDWLESVCASRPS